MRWIQKTSVDFHIRCRKQLGRSNKQIWEEINSNSVFTKHWSEEQKKYAKACLDLWGSE